MKRDRPSIRTKRTSKPASSLLSVGCREDDDGSHQWITHGTRLEAEDFANEQIKFTIEVRHKPNSEFDEKANPERVDILTGVAEAAAPAPAAVATHLDFVQNDENAGPPAAKKARTDA